MSALSHWIHRFFLPNSPAKHQGPRQDFPARDPRRADHNHRSFHDAVMSRSPGDRRQVDIYRYRSESELHDQWRGLDVPRGQDRLTAVFVLNEDLHCNIRDLIRRRHVASRLIIVPTLRRWPSLESPVDLMLATSELGWNSIDVCRDIGQALDSGFAALGAQERLTLFVPAPVPAFPWLSDASHHDPLRPVM